jgi:SAM-dependent methyltransferase
MRMWFAKNGGGYFVCPSCKYACSTLLPALDDKMAYDAIIHDVRESGLHLLRKKNFDLLFRKMVSLQAPGNFLLEVGSGHGWFLEIARNSYHVVGIEPEDLMVQRSVNAGLPVRHGLFPQSLESGECFDLIVFNDTFEHLPDVKNCLEACRMHLNEGGLLVLNLPNSDGMIYNISKVLARLGLTSFFERMWQKDLPSPHLHYFNHANLRKLLKNFGFTELAFGYLDSFILSGLKERIMMCKNFPFAAKISAYLIAVTLYPVWSISKDIMYIIAKK